MDDLCPNDFEVVISSLIVLIHQEKDVEMKIQTNSEDIRRRVKEQVIPPMPAVSAKEDDTNCNKGDEGRGDSLPEASADTSHSAEDNEGGKEEGKETDGETKSPNETIPIVKKIFKQIALICHPDKVKDVKHNKLFIHARKAHDENDLLTLIYISSRCNLTLEFTESEVEDIKDALEKRHMALTNKKETVTYKWNTYTENVKCVLIHQIIKK